MGSLDLTVELRRARFDIDMPHPLVFDVVVELCLELMAPVGADRMDAERELLDHVVNEVYGILLIVTLVNSQGPDSGGVIDGHVLKTADPAVICGLKAEELDIQLDVVARHLLGVPTCMDRPTTHVLRQSPHAIANQGAVNGGAGGLDPVIALDVPGDSLRPEMVSPPKVENLLDRLRG